MQSVQSFAGGLVGCLLGVGLAVEWPAVGQQSKTVVPASPAQKVLAPAPNVPNLQAEVTHLRSLWKQQLSQDVDLRDWAYASTTALQAQGVLKDYPAGFFRGRRVLTRYEFAIAIGRMQKDAPLADSRDQAVLDDLARAFRSDLALIKENQQLPRDLRWL